MSCNLFMEMIIPTLPGGWGIVRLKGNYICERDGKLPVVGSVRQGLLARPPPSPVVSVCALTELTG